MTLAKQPPLQEKKPPGIVIGYILGTLVSIMGAVLLALNIINFYSSYNYYLSQGYPAPIVMQQLIPSQLVPGVFEPIAVYGGIAFLIFSACSIMKALMQQHLDVMCPMPVDIKEDVSPLESAATE